MRKGNRGEFTRDISRVALSENRWHSATVVKLVGGQVSNAYSSGKPKPMPPCRMNASLDLTLATKDPLRFVRLRTPYSRQVLHRNTSHLPSRRNPPFTTTTFRLFLSAHHRAETSPCPTPLLASATPTQSSRTIRPATSNPRRRRAAVPQVSGASASASSWWKLQNHACPFGRAARAWIEAAITEGLG